MASALGKEAGKVTNGTCIHSLQSSLWNLRKEENGGEKGFTLPGQGGIVSVDIWLWKWNSKASICFQNLRFSSTKFSKFRLFFVCLFLKMRKGVCGVVVCVPGYQHKHECLACAAPFRFLPIAICFVVGCALDHSPLRLPNTRTKLGSKKCVFWYVELSLIAASLLAEEAHNNLGIFCFTLCFIKLSLV